MLHLSPVFTGYCIFLAAILGAAMGSFLGCLGWRIVHGESVLRGRSHCDACGHVLGVRDLVPVVSYLASGGKCRYCGGKLPRKYVWEEIISAVVFVAGLLKFDLSAALVQYLLLSCVLLGAAFADLEGYIIPNRFIIAGIVLRAVFIALDPEPGKAALDAGLGGFAVGGALLAVVLLYEKLARKEAMGGGDLKLLFVTGLYLGWTGNILCLMTACVLGIGCGVVMMKKGESLIPWGPSIGAACILVMLFGEPVIRWYLGLF